MTKSVFRPAIVIAGLAVVLFGCASSTQLADTWRDPSYRAAPMNNVYVVAVRKDAVRRRQWEDAYVSVLTERGMKAVPSYLQFPDAPPDTDQVVGAVQASGYDGVVISMRLPNSLETTEVPSTVTTVPVTRWNRFRGRYYTAFREVYQPGYVETNDVRNFQTDVWSADESGSLVWSATVRTLDPAGEAGVRDVVAKKIVARAVKDGIFR
jgi:hypothetical protein